MVDETDRLLDLHRPGGQHSRQIASIGEPSIVSMAFNLVFPGSGVRAL